MLLGMLRRWMGLEQGVKGWGLGWLLAAGVLLGARWHVPLWWWAVRRDHRAGFAAGSVVGVRVGWGHVRVVVVAGILLVLHRRLAVHLVVLLVHRVMLLVRMVMHVGRGTVFAVGRVLGWTWMAGRIIWMHSRWRWRAFRMRRMGGRWSTGCR